MMRHRWAIVCASVAIGFGNFAPTSAGSRQAATEWTTLFDGRNLDHWNAIGTANWRLADGGVEANTGTGFLVTKQPYGDFHLRLEFWVSDDANSGVFIPGANPQQVGTDNYYEVNIFDRRPDPAYRTGGIVDVAKPASQINAGGRWNTYEITAQGPTLTVTLNGVKTVDVENSRFARGHIALQYGVGIVKFRNVQIRPL